jgi:aquaporin Z
MVRRCFAEGLGTFVLVVGGVGTAVLAGDKVGALGISFAFGLSLLVMVYVIGPISGCHINPAVTAGLFVARKVAARNAVSYVIAQLVGAILAAGMILLVADSSKAGYSASASGLGANGYGAHSQGGYGVGGVFLIELLLTGFLVLTVLGATDVRAPVGFAGLAIGLVLTLDHLVAIPVDGTSVNPARSIGPALFVGAWALSQLWLFVVAPLIGAVAAAVVFRLMRPAEPISASEAERATPGDQMGRLVAEAERRAAGTVE